MREHETFQYTYSAKQRDEVKRIRQKYAPPQEDKMEQLRRLDESAERPGTVAALAVGVAGTLVLGTGMSCVMVWPAYFIPGIVIGVIGLAGVVAAYPLYRVLTRRRREKLAPLILALSEELMGE